MKRFFGMMPSSEVEIIKTFRSNNYGEVTIEAGQHGWTIMFADCSAQYEDIEDTAENNFNKAFEKLKEIFSNFDFKEIKEEYLDVIE